MFLLTFFKVSSSNSAGNRTVGATFAKITYDSAGQRKQKHDTIIILQLYLKSITLFERSNKLFTKFPRSLVFFGGNFDLSLPCAHCLAY